MEGYKRMPSKEQRNEWKRRAKENEREAFDMIQSVAENYREDPDKIIEYLRFASEFYQYSQRNITLIYAQNPHATFVQSYQAWKEMGESVKRGAKGIKILLPTIATYLEAGEEEWTLLSQATEQQKALYKAGKIKSRQSMRFKVGNVFDISQTTFPPEKYPEFFSVGYDSDKHRQITDGLIAYAKEVLSCPTTTGQIDSIALFGYYVPSENRIVLNERMADSMRLSTMSHELGHALIHRTMPNTSTAQKEFEGDAISIMLQKRYGIKLTEERRSHLSDHYKRFRQECETKLRNQNPEMIKEKILVETDQMIRESFQNVFQIYKDQIEQIEQYVEQEMTMEKREEIEYGHLIKERREEIQITQTELSYLSMLSVDDLKQIEAGQKKPDDMTLILIANTLGVYTSALEEGKLVEQNRKDITEVIHEIKKEIEETAFSNTYILQYMELCGIDTGRYQAHPKELAPEEERYVIFDTMEETYIKNEDGTVKEWENVYDARAYADSLNMKLSEIGEYPIKEAVEGQNKKTEAVQEFVPNFGTNGKKKIGRSL